MGHTLSCAGNLESRFVEQPQERRAVVVHEPSPEGHAGLVGRLVRAGFPSLAVTQRRGKAEHSRRAEASPPRARRVRGTSARGTCNKLAADQIPSRLPHRSGANRMSARATGTPALRARIVICRDASTATTSNPTDRKCAASRPGPQPRSATRPPSRTFATKLARNSAKSSSNVALRRTKSSTIWS